MSDLYDTDHAEEWGRAPLEAGLMARLIFNRAHRVVLWTLTSGGRPRTLPADNLDDPAVHLLAMGLVEVVDGRLRATQAGYDLRKLIAREER